MSPSEGYLMEVVDEALAFARRAPSPRNVQPWLFQRQGTGFTLMLEGICSRPVADPFDRELIISCGVALGYAHLYLRSAGVDSASWLFPRVYERQVLADLMLTGKLLPPDTEAKRLVGAISKRTTNWGRFDDEPFSADDERALCNAAMTDGVDVTAVPESQRAAVLSLIRLADGRQLTKPGFQAELRRWPQGRPAPALAKALALDSQHAAWSAGRDAHEQGGRLFLLSTIGDSDEDWMRAGQTLGAYLLAAAARGLATSFLNQPLQLADLRYRLRTVLTDAGWPQVLLRVGHSLEQPVPTPRKRPDEVVV